jgi:hypothetical protein
VFGVLNAVGASNQKIISKEMSFLDRKYRHCVSEAHYEVAPKQTKQGMKRQLTISKSGALPRSF